MKWGLIGASKIASDWVIRAIRANEGQTVGALYSTSRERAAEYAARHEISRTYADLDEFLEQAELDAVYISTTNDRHAPECIASARSGLHVLCEKPLGRSLGEADSMIQACKKAGVVLGVNHHLRCSAVVGAVKLVLGEGRIGRPLVVRVQFANQSAPHPHDWRFTQPAAGAGVALDRTVHTADTLRFLLREDPVEVTSMVHVPNRDLGIEDDVMSLWRFPSGAMAQCHEGSRLPDAPTVLEVHGTAGSLLARNVTRPHPEPRIELMTSKGAQDIPVANMDPYARTVERFVAAAGGEGEPAATGADGFMSLAVALAVKESAARRQTATIDYGVREAD